MMSHPPPGFPSQVHPRGLHSGGHARGRVGVGMGGAWLFQNLQDFVCSRSSLHSGQLHPRGCRGPSKKQTWPAATKLTHPLEAMGSLLQAVGLTARKEIWETNFPGRPCSRPTDPPSCSSPPHVCWFSYSSLRISRAARSPRRKEEEPPWVILLHIFQQIAGLLKGKP